MLTTTSVTFFGLTTWFTKIPVYRNAELATHWPPPHSARKGGEKVKNMTGTAPDDLPDGSKPKFQLIIFFHGLGGSRLVYSSVCGEFAGYSFTVIAPEHCDGSGACSVVNYGPEASFL
ncbi:uncharacterized protein DFL_006485 [Arthrobotrys flagrans]|uniref:1-alkyl-2-acetylglycerophosphocholine esterase n=1 Tax=Arthrobotrys flagrans TaxID=97331 RepID=A0A437A0X4_ARTFL|nr:hypothetical protein DFL_006485 [Arthrobotrys flagrans]